MNKKNDSTRRSKRGSDEEGVKRMNVGGEMRWGCGAKDILPLSKATKQPNRWSQSIFSIFWTLF